VNQYRTYPVAACIALIAALQVVGCGGGGGEARKLPIVAATQLAPGTFLIDPGATWKPNPAGDYDVASLVSVDLALLNNGQALGAGRVLEVTSAGRFQFNAKGDLSVVAAGLLVNASGLGLTPGSGSTVGAVSASTVCGQPDIADSIPEDFSIPNDSVATLVVPEGARAMRLSVSDCYYSDNSIYSADPIRVIITLKPQ
jgi:hypothetical protein